MGAYVPIQQDREPGWFETLGQIYQNQAQQQLMQARAQEMETRGQEARQRNQAFLDDQAIRRALAPDIPLAGETEQPRTFGENISRLRQIPIPAAQAQATAMQKDYTEQQAADADLQKKHLENHKAKLDLAGQIVNGIIDQNSYDAGIPQLEQLGILHPGSAPPVFDPKTKPAFMQSIQQAALTADQHLHHLEAQDTASREQQRFEWQKTHAQQVADALAQWRKTQQQRWSQQHAPKNGGFKWNGFPEARTK